MSANGPKHWSECASEAEEARWWDEHPEYTEKLIEEAAAKGEAEIAPKAIAVRDTAPTRPVTITLSAGEREKLHRIAEQLGVDDADYARELLAGALKDVLP